MKGEDKGRTTHESNLSNLNDAVGTIELSFDHGAAVVFLNNYEIVAQVKNQKLCPTGHPL